jgi:hypothetical protein
MAAGRGSGTCEIEGAQAREGATRECLDTGRGRGFFCLAGDRRIAAARDVCAKRAGAYVRQAG